LYACASINEQASWMACEPQGEFIEIVKRYLPVYFAGTRVIEMGSLDINGSARLHFEGACYVGVDVGPGPSVDIVAPGQLFDGPSGSYDCALSANCFEHNPYWLETFINMLRLVREDGLVLFTCASTGYREHGTRRSAPEASPLTVAKGWEYYRNLRERDFTSRLALRRWLSDWRFFVDHEAYCLYFVGLRGGSDGRRLPPALERDVGERFGPWRSLRAVRHRAKVALFGDFLSSPLSYYLRGRR
jgi:SAM-dependent methyltransferase